MNESVEEVPAEDRRVDHETDAGRIDGTGDCRPDDDTADERDGDGEPPSRGYDRLDESSLEYRGVVSAGVSLGG